MEINRDTKVALVHDFLTQYGGAERVLEVLCEMFPEAPIYTLLYDKERMREKFINKEIHTSFLQKFPGFLRKRPKWLLPFFPIAPETFNLREFDLVISSSGAWSKGIVTKLHTIHIAYLHSPMRFAWDYAEKYLKEEKGKKFGIFLWPYLSYLRIWDSMAADRPDYILSNSKYTRDRVKKYYRRESAVIYPPVERGTHNVERVANNAGRENSVAPRSTLHAPRYFLVVSRLSPYKKIDAVIEAFNKLQLPLVIVGEGKQEKYLKSIAGENIKFMGWMPDNKLDEIYHNTRAFVFPTIDDFGLAPAEAMSRGVPIIAIKKGGIREIMVENKTGEFFDVSTPEIIADGVRRFIENEKKYDREFIKNRAGEFGKERFIKEMMVFINKVVENK